MDQGYELEIGVTHRAPRAGGRNAYRAVEEVCPPARGPLGGRPRTPGKPPEAFTRENHTKGYTPETC